jgi:hypothetical protein
MKHSNGFRTRSARHGDLRGKHWKRRRHRHRIHTQHMKRHGVCTCAQMATSSSNIGKILAKALWIMENSSSLLTIKRFWLISKLSIKAKVSGRSTDTMCLNQECTPLPGFTPNFRIKIPLTLWVQRLNTFVWQVCSTRRSNASLASMAGVSLAQRDAPSVVLIHILTKHLMEWFAKCVKWGILLNLARSEKSRASRWDNVLRKITNIILVNAGRKVEVEL